ncbi:MAG: SUMF1/EgtB/PvdO family nonheme iron enzyme [Candidatus Rokubacteria bacterium]|nr:SUMF1/EgtB/PvdO family nonheme iron enzyme [Candidatus Rokubacteria bacterium]
MSVVPFPTPSPAAASCPAGMVLVPGGDFVMGSDASERRLAYARSSPAVRDAAWFDAELSRRTVSLAAFCIDRTLVSQSAYAEFVRATGHRRPGIARADYRRQGFLVHDYDRDVVPYLWTSGTPPARLARHPVVLVSAPDAEASCRWRQPGGRLPGEAEWEKASRGTDGRLFPWGDSWDASGASPFGILDAVGNVFQWTATALGDGRRVLKGCAWDDELSLCRPAFRHGRPPQSRHILIGFRCARSLVP